MDGYITTRRKCQCGGSFKYDERRRDLFCDKCEARCTGTYIVKMGKKHYKSFGRNLAAAEQHLNHIRCQKGQPEVYGTYDPRDWQKDNANGLKTLGESWVKKKRATRPPLEKTRMADIENAIARAVAFWGDRNIKQLTEPDLIDFYTHPHKDLRDDNKPLSSKTVYDLCMTLNQFFAWAAKIAGCEPVRFTEMGYEFSETEPISIQQQQAIIDWLEANCPEPKLVFAVTTLCRNPNVRPGELIEVQWRHVDLISGIIYIHKRKSRRKLGRRAAQPKKIFVTEQQLDWLKSCSYEDLNDYLFVYDVPRSGVTPGQRIHKKVLNIWFKKAGRAMGVETYLYAGTKHTTTTELRRHFDREAVMNHGTGHRSDAFGHYDHSDGTREALEMRKAYDKMRAGIKAVK